MKIIGVVTALVLAGGCITNDPQYVAPAEAIEVGVPGSDVNQATAMVTLPIRLEEPDEAEERAALAAELGVDIPYVKREDLELSLEWTIRNLSDTDGTARIHINGANEYFAYIPSAFVVDPEEEEEPPPLAGDVPLLIGAQSTVSGVFREDQIAEAALDLELITRAALNPFTAMLEIHEEMETVDDGMGFVIPVDVTPHLIRFDITFIADRHMVIEYAIRARDFRDPPLLHDEGLAADPAELTAFAPVDFMPVLEPMM